MEDKNLNLSKNDTNKDNEKEINEETENFLTLMNTSNTSYISSFFNKENIKNVIKKKNMSGIDSLDNIISGGFLEGSINVIGGGSSVGKSSLVLQIAKNISKSTPVLYFSMEMTPLMLSAKLLSSELYEKYGVGNPCVKSASEIMSSESIEYNDLDWQIIGKTVDEMENKFSKNLYLIYPKNCIPTINWIRKNIKNFIEVYDKIPFVVLDYLQLISVSAKKNLSDKQIIDYILLELRKLASEKKVTFLVISSLNRDSYDKPVTMSSFKESGNIEFTADLILGMNLYGVGKSNFDLKKIKNTSKQTIQIDVLKQRYGQSLNSTTLSFDGKYSYFDDVGSAIKVKNI